MRARILQITALLVYRIFAMALISCASLKSNIDSNNADFKIESKAVSKAKETSLKSPKGLKYYPQTKDELINLAWDNSINLGDIDTSKITDMNYLFANTPKDDCDWVKSEYKENKEGLIDIITNDNEKKMNHQEAINLIENILLKSCEYPPRKDFSGIESWDTSNVEDMSWMFYNSVSFNQNINSWNVSKVKTMKGMFYEAKSFNQPIDKWDTSNVEDMTAMFVGAKSFNQSLNSWNVSRVKNMQSMFFGAKAFNQPLNKWDTSNVTNMRGMFWWAESFNQDLESWGDKLNKDCEIDSIMFKSSPLESNPPKWYKEKMGKLK